MKNHSNQVECSSSVLHFTQQTLWAGKFTFNITHCTIKAFTCTAQMQACKSLVMISRTVQINRHCIACIPRTRCMYTLIHPMYFYPFSKNHKFLIPNLVLFTDFPHWSISTFFIIPLQIRRVNEQKKQWRNSQMELKSEQQESLKRCSPANALAWLPVI